MTTAQDHNGPFNIPREGSKTRAVWTMCDELKKKGVTERKVVLSEGRKRKMADGTVNCQVGRWQENNDFKFVSQRKSSVKKRKKPLAGKMNVVFADYYTAVRHEVCCEEEYKAAKSKWVESTRDRKALEKSK